MVDRTYRLTSDQEPTDEQLEALMLEVLKDVKKRAAIAEKKHYEKLMRIMDEPLPQPEKTRKIWKKTNQSSSSSLVRMALGKLRLRPKS